MSASRLCVRCGHGTGSQRDQFFIALSCQHQGTLPLCVRCVETVRTDPILQQELRDTVDALCGVCREERELARVRREIPTIQGFLNAVSMEAHMSAPHLQRRRKLLRDKIAQRDARSTLSCSTTNTQEATQLQVFLQRAWEFQEAQLSGQDARMVRKLVHILVSDPTLSHLEALTDEDLSQMMMAKFVLSHRGKIHFPDHLVIKLHTAATERPVPVLEWWKWF